MRFPDQPGLIAGLSLSVTDLARAMPFWRGVLHPLGFGRTNSGPDWCLWAREGAQIVLLQKPAPTAAMQILLRAPERTTVGRLHATAQAGSASSR